MTREMIYRYLAEQVFESLKDEERQFIETAAILPHIDLPVLMTLGFDDASAVLNDLRQRVAFIHEVEPGRFRLHDLFREFALHQLSLRGNAAVLERYTKIAEILLVNDDPVGALRLYLTANNWDAVQKQLETRGLALVSHGYADDVEQSLSALPSAQQQAPVLTLLRGVIAVARGRYAAGESHLRSSLETLEDRSLRSDAALRLALMQANRGEDASTVLLDVLSDDAVDDGRKLEARAILAGYCAASGDKEASRTQIAILEEQLPDIADQERLARVLQRLGFAYNRLDEPELATVRSKHAAEIASSRGLWSLAARAYAQLSLVAVMNDHQSSLALWNAQQAASAASRAGDYFDLQTSLLMMLSLETRRGNVDRAQQIERQLGELGSSDSSRAHYITSSQAHRQAWNGRFGDAHRLFGSVLGRQLYASDRALIHSLFALTLALDGQVQQSITAAQEAQTLIDRSDASALEGALLFESARLFLVATELLNGRVTAAGRLLKKRPMTTHDIASCMREVVEDLVREARSPSYEAEDFNARLDTLRDFGFGGFGRYFALVREFVHSRHHEESDVNVSLTPSELKILRALAAGMSPKDIAVDMGRSVYTVQTHIQNLTEKLGCHGRAEAIAAARRRGLLVAGSNAST
jgi:LuxR family maltose regulon positive regulatory protein